MTNPPRCNVFCCQMKKPYLIPLVYKIEVTSDKSKRFIHTIGHPKIWAFINDILVLLYSNWCLFFRAEFFYKINNSQKILVHITPSFYNYLSHIRFYFITNRIITQEKKRTSIEVLFSWPTRIRTLKWRSQSPLPYHLAMGQCVVSTKDIIHMWLYSVKHFFILIECNWI